VCSKEVSSAYKKLARAGPRPKNKQRSLVVGTLVVVDVGMIATGGGFMAVEV